MDEKKICEIVGRLYLESISLKEAVNQQQQQLEEQKQLLISIQTNKNGSPIISNPNGV